MTYHNNYDDLRYCSYGEYVRMAEREPKPYVIEDAVEGVADRWEKRAKWAYEQQWREVGDHRTLKKWAEADYQLKRAAYAAELGALAVAARAEIEIERLLYFLSDLKKVLPTQKQRRAARHEWGKAGFDAQFSCVMFTFYRDHASAHYISFNDEGAGVWTEHDQTLRIDLKSPSGHKAVFDARALTEWAALNVLEAREALEPMPRAYEYTCRCRTGTDVEIDIEEDEVEQRVIVSGGKGTARPSCKPKPQPQPSVVGGIVEMRLEDFSNRIVFKQARDTCRLKLFNKELFYGIQ